MSDPNDRFDNRLRTLLGDLAETAERRVRPTGAGAASAAGRSRRRAVRAGGAVLALVLTAGLATGVWLAGDAVRSDHDDRMAGSGCQPAEGWAYLPADTTPELRTQVGTLLGRSPEVSAAGYESKEEAYRRFMELYGVAPDAVRETSPENVPEAWRFTLRCAADYPALKERLAALPGVDVVCSCDPRAGQPAPPPGGRTWPTRR